MIIKNLIEIKNTQKLNKNRLADGPSPKTNQISGNPSNSVSNFNANFSQKTPLLNQSNEVYRNILEGNFNFENLNSSENFGYRSIHNYQTKNFLSPPCENKNNRKFHSPEINLLNRRIETSEEKDLYQAEGSLEKHKVNNFNVSGNKISEGKFVLNSLKEFHSNNNNNNFSNNLSLHTSNNLINSLNYQNDPGREAVQNNKTFKAKAEKKIFPEIFKDQEKKGELIKLETIFEQKFDKTNYNNINVNPDPYTNDGNLNQIEPNQADFLKKLNHINNKSSNAKSLNFTQNLGVAKTEKNLSLNSQRISDFASISKNDYVVRENGKSRNFKKFQSQSSLFDYLKSHENSYSEKNIKDQMIYLIRKNINEIKLNNPLLGGRDSEDLYINSNRKFIFRRKDYFIRTNLDVHKSFDPNVKKNRNNNNNNSSKNHNNTNRYNTEETEDQSKKVKKKTSKAISKRSFRKYSLDLGSMHKKYNFLSLKNLNQQIPEKSFLFNNNKKINSIYNQYSNYICITDSSIFQKKNNILLKSNKKLRNNLIPKQPGNRNASHLNTIETVNRMNQTEISPNLSFDSNKFDFEDEFNSNNFLMNSLNIECEYLNTAPNQHPDISRTNQNANFPYMSMILNTYETLDTQTNSNMNSKRGRENQLDHININMNFVMDTGENKDKDALNKIKNEFLNFENSEKIETPSRLDLNDQIPKKGLVTDTTEDQRDKKFSEIESNIADNKQINDSNTKQNNSNNQDKEQETKLLNETNKNQSINAAENQKDFNFKNSKNKKSQDSKSISRIKKHYLSLNLNNISSEKLYVGVANKESNLCDKTSERNIIGGSEYTSKHKKRKDKSKNFSKKNLENLDDSKIETKSVFSNKLFSENSFDDGIREEILSGNSFFIKADRLDSNSNNNIDDNKNNFLNDGDKEKKIYEKFKDQTNNFSFMKSDYKYLPIEKSIEAKRLRFLQGNTKKFLDNLKLNPVQYHVSEGDELLKFEEKNKSRKFNLNENEKELLIFNSRSKIENSSDFMGSGVVHNIDNVFRVKSENGNTNDKILKNIELSKVNHFRVKSEKLSLHFNSNTNENIVTNANGNLNIVKSNVLINNKKNKENADNSLKSPQQPNALSSSDGNFLRSNSISNNNKNLNDCKIKKSKITNINYDFMKEFNAKANKAESLKDNYYFENYIKKQKESIQQTKEFLNNLRNESENNIMIKSNLYNSNNHNDNFNLARNKNNFNKNSSNCLLPSCVNHYRNNNIFSPVSLNAHDSNMLFSKNLKHLDKEIKLFAANSANIKVNGEKIIDKNDINFVKDSDIKEYNTKNGITYDKSLIEGKFGFVSDLQINNCSNDNKRSLSIKSPSNIYKMDIKAKFENVSFNNCGLKNEVSNFYIHETEKDIKNEKPAWPQKALQPNLIDKNGKLIMKNFDFPQTSKENKSVKYNLNDKHKNNLKIITNFNEKISNNTATKSDNMKEKKKKKNLKKDFYLNFIKNNKQNKEGDSLLQGIGSFILSPLNNNKEHLISNCSDECSQNLLKTPNNLLLNSNKNKNFMGNKEKGNINFSNSSNNYINQLNNSKNIYIPNSLNKKPKKDEDSNDDSLAENNICKRVNINLDVDPHMELLDKLQKLRLNPVIAKKYSVKNDEIPLAKITNVFLKSDLNQRQNILNNIEHDNIKEIANSEFTDNDTKSPRIRRLISLGNEMILRSSPVGRFYSKKKKD